MMKIDLKNQEYACCSVIPYAMVDHMVNMFMDILNSIIRTNGTPIDPNDVEAFLQNTEKVLHPNHYLRLIAKRYLVQLLPHNDSKKLEFCQDILETFNVLDAGLSHSRGMTIYEMFKATNNTKLLDEVLQCLHMEPPDSIAGKAYAQAAMILKSSRK